jgi:hypothetical protein
VAPISSDGIGAAAKTTIETRPPALGICLRPRLLSTTEKDQADMSTQVDQRPERPFARLAKKLAEGGPSVRAQPNIGAAAEVFIGTKVRERYIELRNALAKIGPPQDDRGWRLAAAAIEQELWLHYTELRLSVEGLEGLIAAWEEPDAMRTALADVVSGRESPGLDVATRAVASAALSTLSAFGDDFRSRARGNVDRRLGAARVGVSMTGSKTRPSSRHRAPCGRQRERRDGSRRHATRGSTDDDSGSGPEPPGETLLGRRCTCGCGRDISHKRADALTFDAGGRKRLSRAKAVRADDPPYRQRCESCGCFLSRYGKGSERCWSCAFGNPDERPILQPWEPGEIAWAIHRADADLASRERRCAAARLQAVAA